MPWEHVYAGSTPATRTSFFVCRGGPRSALVLLRTKIRAGASGEIRTLKHLFLRQAAIPIRTRWPRLLEGSAVNCFTLATVRARQRSLFGHLGAQGRI